LAVITQEGPAKPATDKHFYSAFDCYNLLKKIPAEDMDAMGLSAEFARPEWMILTVLPVPPAPVRPSVASPGKASAQDDLTYKLAEIIKANGSVEKAEQEGSPQYIINNFVELLQVRTLSRALTPRYQAKLLSLSSVSRLYVHGQRLRWCTDFKAKGRSSYQIHSSSIEGKGRKTSRQSHGKASRLLGSNSPHGRSPA